MSIALILLAAGGSTRMGRAKQLLPYRGSTLLRHAVDNALASRCRPVVVVIGSQAPQMRAELAGLPIQVVSNPAWANGMGGSIRAGLKELIETVDPDAAVITLCDQPAVSGWILDRLVDRYHADDSPIVASSYDGITGVPALFDRTMFDELLELEDSGGARQLIQRHADLVACNPFPQGTIDVDTPEDYDRLF